MSLPPPQNLMDWPKGDLIKEVTRLRAVLHEHSERVADPARSSGDFADVAGDPRAHGGVVIDTRGAVLMDHNDIMLVDPKPGSSKPPVLAFVLEGRVNLSTQRVKQLYLFGTDGAAAIVSQIVGLASRGGRHFAEHFQDDPDRRMKELS